MDIDLSQYMGMYVDGSRENLDLMDKFLLALEQDPSNLEAIGEIFRAAHTLKGMSATMGFEKVAHLTHEMESILDQLRNRQLEVSPVIIDVVFETFDVLRTLVNDSIEATDSNIDIEVIVKKLHDAAKGKSVASKVEAKAVTAEEKPVVAEAKPVNTQGSEESQLALELADISMNEFEQQLLIEAHQHGSHILLMVVTLVPDCLLKAPRAFMVARCLEDLCCEIIKSVPETKDIEEEKFDLSFKMVLLGDAEDEKVKYAIESISEIESVKVTRLKPEDFELQPGVPVSAAEPAPTPEPPKPVPAPRPTPAPQPAKVATAVQPAPPPAPKQAAPPPPPPPPPPKPPAPPAGGPPPKPGDKKQAATADKRGSQTVRVDMKRLDDLMNLVGELVINRTRLEDIGAAHKLKDLNEALSRVSQISASLQNVVMQVRMVPIEQVFDRFPRMVRDLSKKLNKKINLVLEGKETEMDRTVIDEIGDPMVHLIRNAIDHGIEMPEERIAKGKPDVGTITLIARHEGNNVLIEVIDDGKGVDPSIIGRLAVERGLFTPEQIAKMPPEEIIKIIFLAGFSTATVVSDLSGRGVGMDAVKAKLEDLNGVLELESKVGEGSRVTIKLPLTLAILPALMVKVGAEMFAIPLGSVLETMDITKADINIVQHQEVTLLRGEVLPIIRLRNVLNVPTTDEQRKMLDAREDELSMVVCASGEKRAGFMVDELFGQQEIVIKSLGNLLSGLPGIMGATMRGDGSIALILDIPSFFQKGQTIQ
ncbi:MAG: chemotaxis protein CheA [Candidatus Riflebacteria bacterium HGW-Riflebacteria-2]|nr:MAG: chemotaxis protein CheA [Candidatus Riflebacteria bacterium HGW-Riflebacteria-2]